MSKKRQKKKKKRETAQKGTNHSSVPKKVCMGKVAKAEDKKVCTAHREILH